MANLNDVTIFSSPIAIGAILPFLLVFFSVFAVLQKSKVFGEGKKQSDALIALITGLIAVSFKWSVDLINSMIPFLAVVLIVLLVFMILVGFLFKEGDFDLPGWVKYVLGIIIFISVGVAVLYFTGAWDKILSLFDGTGSTIAFNLLFIILIVGAILSVVLGKGGDRSSK